jgi:adenosylhomocysteine nucleosidase
MNRIFVAALKEETPNLDFFHFTGVGKINATYNLTKIIHKYSPKEIINFGTAGAIDKNLNGIIECTKFYQRDMDASAIMNLKVGQTPFDDINEIIHSKKGYSCGSGDSFVNKQIPIKVDVVDMEAYAIAKACIFAGVEFKCYKYVSDQADENASKDWQDTVADGEKHYIEIYQQTTGGF